MKAIKWIVVILLVVIVVGALVVYFNLNGIVRRTVETQTSSSLNLKTTLEGANLSLFGGKLGLDDLQIASPQGFSAPHMFTLDDVAVSVRYGQLRDDPIRIQSIRLDEPRLVIEQAGGKFNFQAAMDNLPKTEEKPSDGKREEGEEIRLIIDELQVNNAKVSLRPGLPGLEQEIDVVVPSLTLTNIGTGEGNQNGAAIKEVVMQLITALAAEASEAGNLSEQLKEELNRRVDEVAGRLSEEFNKQLERIQEEIGKKLPGDLGTVVGDVLEDPKLREKDPGKAVEEGLRGLLGEKEKRPTTQPAPKSP